MNRRRFLGTAGLTTVGIASGWPTLIRDAFAALQRPPTLELGLEAAYHRAKEWGKPLLVLIVPPDPQERYHRGQAFGEWINHGTDEMLAHLALCEVACAPLSDVNGLVGKDLSGAPWLSVGSRGQNLLELHRAQPWMVLVETGEQEKKTQMVKGVLPAHRDFIRRGEQSWEEQQQQDARTSDQRIEYLDKMLRRMLVPSKEQLGRRANEASAPLGTEDRKAVARVFLQGALPSVELADRAAAALLLVAETANERVSSDGSPRISRDRLIPRLAEAAVQRLRQKRLPGSKWARSSGCGVIVEGEDESVAYGCGMGHVPQKSQRFLQFYVKASQNHGK